MPRMYSSSPQLTLCHPSLINSLTTSFYYVLVFMYSALPSLIDRLGDAKDQVREQDQALLLKIMEQAASPQV